MKVDLITSATYFSGYVFTVPDVTHVMRKHQIFDTWQGKAKQLLHISIRTKNIFSSRSTWIRYCLPWTSGNIPYLPWEAGHFREDVAFPHCPLKHFPQVPDVTSLTKHQHAIARIQSKIYYWDDPAFTISEENGPVHVRSFKLCT